MTAVAISLGVVGVHASTQCVRFITTKVRHHKVSAATAARWAAWDKAHPNWHPKKKLPAETLAQLDFACAVPVIQKPVDGDLPPLELNAFSFGSDLELPAPRRCASRRCDVGAATAVPSGPALHEHGEPAVLPAGVPHPLRPAATAADDGTLGESDRPRPRIRLGLRPQPRTHARTLDVDAACHLDAGHRHTRHSPSSDGEGHRSPSLALALQRHECRRNSVGADSRNAVAARLEGHPRSAIGKLHHA